MTQRSATGDSPVSVEEAPTNWPTVPGYEILAELGRGGMGVVYKARQMILKRLVALKLIRDSALAGPQERTRFRIEAEAAARMQHPNIVQIYEAGEHLGRPYFTMEFVEGGSLDQHLAGRPQPAAPAAELVRTLALAVQHAHGQQVVHRDLKPANILLQNDEFRMANDERMTNAKTPMTKQGEQPLRHSVFDIRHSFVIGHSSLGIPKITDFGLAKRLDNANSTGTQDGAVLGTASYMAPEQAAGRVREVGPTTDVYALGAILYELLTGRPPFRADSWNRTVEQVLHDEPLPPTRWHADVPRDLETICLKCLEKESGRRYASALELADDLGRFLDGKSVAAVPLGERERLARLAARDGYQLGEEIGRGPRSTVYRALYGQLKQPVALKVFAAGACTRPEWEARLQRGADLWIALTHPHIVPVQRAGWWDGAPYLVVEYVPGGSLAARLGGRPGPVREALRLVEQLTEVVGYVHRQGVVHGNLKPSNVLLAADGIPRLVDFRPPGGFPFAPLASGEEGLGVKELPADDSAAVSVGYLAPELVRDAGTEPGPYTDIYGLGLILYELLAGRPPFAAATAREVLEQVRSQTPVLPSQFNSHVTPHLDALCLRCLRKNPWRRYHRAYDLLTRLQYFQDHPDGPAPGQQPKRRPSGREDVPRFT